MASLRTLRVALATLSLTAFSLAHAGGIETRAVQFSQGHAAATIKGSVHGDQTIDYIVRARAGQALSVKLATKHGANYFNVLPPGSNDVALFVGSMGGAEWAGVVSADGDYKVRVYLMRSAARRHETARYTLTVGLTGAALPADLGQAPASDVKVKGTPYHATGTLPCQMGNDPPTQCEFGVIRGKPGHAEVHITLPSGLKRVLTFRGDHVTTTPSDPLKAVKNGDNWTIEVNDREHFTLPEAVVQGG